MNSARSPPRFQMPGASDVQTTLRSGTRPASARRAQPALETGLQAADRRPAGCGVKHGRSSWWKVHQRLPRSASKRISSALGCAPGDRADRSSRRCPVAARAVGARRLAKLLEAGDLVCDHGSTTVSRRAAQRLSVGNRHDVPLKSERLLVLSPGRAAELRPSLRRYRSAETTERSHMILIKQI